MRQWPIESWPISSRSCRKRRTSRVFARSSDRHPRWPPGIGQWLPGSLSDQLSAGCQGERRPGRKEALEICRRPGGRLAILGAFKKGDRAALLTSCQSRPVCPCPVTQRRQVTGAAVLRGNVHPRGTQPGWAFVVEGFAITGVGSGTSSASRANTHRGTPRHCVDSWALPSVGRTYWPNLRRVTESRNG
jgi:hypothetical protein